MFLVKDFVFWEAKAFAKFQAFVQHLNPFNHFIFSRGRNTKSNHDFKLFEKTKQRRKKATFYTIKVET